METIFFSLTSDKKLIHTKYDFSTKAFHNRQKRVFFNGELPKMTRIDKAAGQPLKKKRE